jgi:hypothetical protein
MRAVSVLTFFLIGTDVGHAQITPTVERTTGPIAGLSVEHQQTAKEYRVLWPGHRIVPGTVGRPHQSQHRGVTFSVLVSQRGHG